MEALKPDSDPIESRAYQVREILGVIVGGLVAIATIELAVAFMFPVTEGTTLERMSTLARYFDYGRSTEGKIRRMAGDTDDSTAPLLLAGWYETARRGAPTEPAQEGGYLIAAYGQSFTERALRESMKVLDKATLRILGGPGSTLSHSVHLYEQDRGQHEADIVVIGILASSFAKIRTMTHMTWNFESPAAHTYPRFVLQEGKLETIEPLIGSMTELREALVSPAKWSAFTDQLATYDHYYDPRVLQSHWDGSALVRVTRRGWGQRQAHRLDAECRSAAGFDDELARLGQAIIRRFVEQVRADHKKPIVILFNDRGYGDDLHSALGRSLADMNVDFVSTHEMAPASNLGNFQADGHFLPELDGKIGVAVASKIRGK